MADLTGGQLVARTLKQAGVGHVFTLCGGHILPIYDGCLAEGIGIIDARHEQAAAHADDAHARLTRGVGVAVVVPGPGVTDAVTGVANAYAARSPVASDWRRGAAGSARSRRAPGDRAGRAAWPDHEGLMVGVGDAADSRGPGATEVRTALSGRPGPVFVEIPVDLLMTTIEDRLAPIPTGYVHRTRAAVETATLGRLGSPAGLCGTTGRDGRRRHLLGRRAEVARGVRGARWGSGLHERRGPGALTTDHPNAFFQTRGWALGHRPLTEALPRGRESRSAPGRAELRRREGEARAKLVELAATDQAAISHYRWAWEIACAVTRDTIVVGDGGDVVNCAAKFVPIDRMGQWMDPGPLGCLGVGPSFALAAKLLRPDQRVLLVSGDGAFGLDGMELETAVPGGVSQGRPGLDGHLTAA